MGGTAAKVTLTETYAGGMIYEECTSCVTEITNVAITSSRSVTTAIGEGFMVQGYTNINQVYSAKSANSPVRLPVLQSWRLRLVHRRVQVLQGLQQRQLRHPEHARRLNWLETRDVLVLGAAAAAPRARSLLLLLYYI